MCPILLLEYFCLTELLISRARALYLLSIYLFINASCHLLPASSSFSSGSLSAQSVRLSRVQAGSDRLRQRFRRRRFRFRRRRRRCPVGVVAGGVAATHLGLAAPRRYLTSPRLLALHSQKHAREHDRQTRRIIAECKQNR